MALKAENEQHEQQIIAGTEGRIKGHHFEAEVSDQLNSIDFANADYHVEMCSPNIYKGNPAVALVEHISNDKKQQIKRLKAYWLGGLATARAGAELKNEAGETITGSKSDIVMDVTYASGEKETIGVSVKSCKNNAQVALTTSNAFCDMLRSNGISVSQDAEIGMKMFCGEPGFSPGDGYVPEDTSNVPPKRTARPERWYWEELSTPVQEEWARILSIYQDKMTICNGQGYGT